MKPKYKESEKAEKEQFQLRKAGTNNGIVINTVLQSVQCIFITKKLANLVSLKLDALHPQGDVKQHLLFPQLLEGRRQIFLHLNIQFFKRWNIGTYIKNSKLTWQPKFYLIVFQTKHLLVVVVHCQSCVID